MSTTHDSVNHPKHYTSHPSGVECITVTRHMTFNIGNVVKYCWRAGLKTEEGKDQRTKQIEDLKKAQFYLADEIKRLEGDGAAPPAEDPEWQLDLLRREGFEFYGRDVALRPTWRHRDQGCYGYRDDQVIAFEQALDLFLLRRGWIRRGTDWRHRRDTGVDCVSTLLALKSEAGLT